MATATSEAKQQGQEATQRGAETEGGVGSPISNVAYNVIAALHAKLEGLEAYRKFSKDGDRDLWCELTQTEVKTVGRLIDELERVVKEGKLRMKEPGRANH